MKETLLIIRNKLKARKPTFKRQDFHKKKRIGTKWRRPKGHQNKMRLKLKSYARSRSSGFGSPLAVKGLSRKGLTQNVVATKKDFESLDPKVDGIILSRTLGDRKRSDLVKVAKDKQFTVLNFDVEAFEKKLAEKMATKKLKRSDMKKRIEKRSKASAKDTKEKKDSSTKEDSSKQSTEDVKEDKVQEKKEHDKILTKKE